jgi:2',3'-cyclic-nucleotide 2'-phosphodiesterase (5'-nucleotidase family)/Ca2+-binding EF-hand superfamily protein
MGCGASSAPQKDGGYKADEAPPPAPAPKAKAAPAPAPEAKPAETPAPEVKQPAPEVKQPVPEVKQPAEEAEDAKAKARLALSALLDDEEPTPPPTECTLRIFTVNDVYELDNLASMKTCIEQNRRDNQVVLLAGDFLGPSLLSSLDHGASMIDMLNRVGIQYVCFGNHEQDVPHAEMLERIKESQFKWINTNMTGLPLSADMQPLPTHEVITVTAGGQTRKVGLLGLNTNDPGLYLPKAWGGVGAKVIDPIEDKAIEFRKKLLDEGCDVVVPMTHQVMPLDRAMAEKCLGFPMIIGGHDHQLYHEEVAGATILKVGADADTVGIIDLTWPDVGTPGESPTISIQKIATSSCAPDPELAERTKLHKKVLEELDKASLFTVPEGVCLSSKKIRLQQVSMGTVIVSSLRDALGAECAIINAGNIRGNTEYPKDLKTFSYSQLKTEMPFDSVVADVPLPGKLINEVVAFTRKWAVQDPPVEKGCYMQIDDKMKWDAETNTVTHIGGKPLDPERIYECVVLWQVAMEGIDGVTPLFEYCKNQVAVNFPHDADVGRPAKQVLVDYFGRAIWWAMIEKVGFAGLDQDKDGQISEKELLDAVHKAPGMEGGLGDLVVKNIMGMADVNHDGYVCKEELLQVCFLSIAMFDDENMDDNRVLSRLEVEDVAKRILGCSYDQELVTKLIDATDANKDGKICFGEVKQRVKELQKQLAI